MILSKCRQNNDLGHPLCQNLRDGNWLIDHIISRINIHNHTEVLIYNLVKQTIRITSFYLQRFTEIHDTLFFRPLHQINYQSIGQFQFYKNEYVYFL